MNETHSELPYVASEALDAAVDAALLLGRPLLVKGEPGTGKTELAHAVARRLGMPLHAWHVKSTTRAKEGLYDYDAVSRLRDSQLGDPRVQDVANYLVRGVLWDAFDADERCVVLIDEIDKADIEFPNDLLQELDRMSFDVHETRTRVSAKHRPLVIITSNDEKELPDAFLRRCFFHWIAFPDESLLRRIVGAHFPDLQPELLSAALGTFFELRDVPGLRKKPSTSELLDWLKLLLADELPIEALHAANPRSALPHLHGALLKNEQDVHLFERLVFLHRRREADARRGGPGGPGGPNGRGGPGEPGGR